MAYDNELARGRAVAADAGPAAGLRAKQGVEVAQTAAPTATATATALERLTLTATAGAQTALPPAATSALELDLEPTAELEWVPPPRAGHPLVDWSTGSSSSAASSPSTPLRTPDGGRLAELASLERLLGETAPLQTTAAERDALL